MEKYSESDAGHPSRRDMPPQPRQRWAATIAKEWRESVEEVSRGV